MTSRLLRLSHAATLITLVVMAWQVNLPLNLPQFDTAHLPLPYLAPTISLAEITACLAIGAYAIAGWPNRATVRSGWRRVFTLALIVLAIFVVVILPRNRAQYNLELAQRNQANTATVAALTSVAQTVNAVTNTLPPPKVTPVPPSATAGAKASATPVVAQPTSTYTPTPNKEAGVDPRTATVAALLTQAAQAKLTTTLTTSTALPKTGFAEDAGIPGLIGLTILFVVVILMVRRMRASAAPR